MPQHNFLFHPAAEELVNYIEAIERVEAQPQFRGQVAVDLQLHQGQWVGELSALTSRKMMSFITEIYMELPPEGKGEGEEFSLVADSPADLEGAQPESEDGTDESGSTEPSSEEEYEQTDEEYEHEEGAPAQTAEQRAKKKLVKPKSVAKTSNSAITVEED